MTNQPSAKLDVYVNYPGHCKTAFEFYAKHLGGQITMMLTHEQAPNPNLPADWKPKILHARLTLGGMELMGADIPNAEPMRSAYLTMRLPSGEEAERVYALLLDGGQIFMPMEETFFAKRFAMLRDKFGTAWMLLHEEAR
jgi:PhnB protein